MTRRTPHRSDPQRACELSRSQALAPGMAWLSATGVCLTIGVSARAAEPTQSELQAKVTSDAATPNDATASTSAPIELVVRGQSKQRRRKNSPEAVKLVDTSDARRESADLGEVLARTPGVSVRRDGGLGSKSRLNLNGLGDDRVRFFLDGVPLELAGFPLGVANVPLNLIDSVEIYAGVVPIRFGSDALGGAVNLVTDAVSEDGTHGSAAYEVGSFDTQRVSVVARHSNPRTGFVARVAGFFDSAANDYPIDVEAPDDQGRLAKVRVHKSNDGYLGRGIVAEFGVAERPYAKRLSARGFYAEHDRDVSHNVLMTVPYGDVSYEKRTAGGSVRYFQIVSPTRRIETILGYSYLETSLRDLSRCRYDWFGRCVAELPQRGEIDARAIDQIIHQHTPFVRSSFRERLATNQALKLSWMGSYLTRTGENRALPEADYDPLSAERLLASGFVGAEHESFALAGFFTNVLSLKSYFQVARTDEQLPNGNLRDLENSTLRFGAGDSLRVALSEVLSAKASYEYATRLPGPDELYGDGALTIENLRLEPEASHNVNLGLVLSALETKLGELRGSVLTFGRFARELIIRVDSGNYFQHRNVLNARSLGVESTLGWSLPREYLSVDGSLTFQDFRNASESGPFADHSGDRVPNTPWLFASARARAQWPAAISEADVVSVTWHARYVHEFFRGWESIGERASKLSIPSQLLHSLAFEYLVRNATRAFSTTLEIQNLSDVDAFDFYGVQRPGRAFYFKIVLDV